MSIEPLKVAFAASPCFGFLLVINIFILIVIYRHFVGFVSQ